MVDKNSIILFNDKKIRRIWNKEKEEWFFSVVDVIEILTDSPRPRKYWNALKTKLKEEGSQLSHKIGQLKLLSSDGKYYLTDSLSTKNILMSVLKSFFFPNLLWLGEKIILKSNSLVLVSQIGGRE
jgi:DNA-damage-inducible protein D